MIETKLHDFSQKFEAFSIAVDESTDVVRHGTAGNFHQRCGYKF
jgi:hypothetical protein